MKRIFSAILAVTMAITCRGSTQSSPLDAQPSTTPTTQATEAAPLPPSSTTEATAPPPVPTTEATEATDLTQPTLPPEPEVTTLLDFLTIAAQPVGSTMYVWGGGWNEADTGAGVEATTLGVSPQWASFARSQTASYDHKETLYQIHDGLDCSGYLGWVVYNTLEPENGRPGYVYPSTKLAQALADLGLGDYIPTKELDRWLPGDVMSMKGHCWIVVGMCDDGSVLLLHASPPGVMFSGTKSPDGSASQATALAQRIMEENYPDWYARYPKNARPHSYLTASSAMRWNDAVLPDPDGLREMSAEEVVDILYPHT